jgi:ribonuclease P protein component
MLPRVNRLKDQADFTRIYKQGRKIWSPFFLAVYNFNPKITAPLIGFVASKKVGGAVQRNHAKRLLREAARAHLRKLPICTELVLVASAKTLEGDFFAINHEIEITAQSITNNVNISA